ncbi:MAG: hypothetical protein F6K55_20210 [Moorea sp. SIO4A3]|nr:hypothetical protein [Moorena sp. SIO4A3]NEQ86793.1 hypothetical protein [Moorena sp. SIO2I5]
MIKKLNPMVRGWANYFRTEVIPFIVKGVLAFPEVTSSSTIE